MWHENSNYTAAILIVGIVFVISTAVAAAVIERESEQNLQRAETDYSNNRSGCLACGDAGTSKGIRTRGEVKR